MGHRLHVQAETTSTTRVDALEVFERWVETTGSPTHAVGLVVFEMQFETRSMLAVCAIPRGCAEMFSLEHKRAALNRVTEYPLGHFRTVSPHHTANSDLVRPLCALVLHLYGTPTKPYQVRAATTLGVPGGHLLTLERLQAEIHTPGEPSVFLEAVIRHSYALLSYSDTIPGGEVGERTTQARHIVSIAGVRNSAEDLGLMYKTMSVITGGAQNSDLQKNIAQGHAPLKVYQRYVGGIADIRQTGVAALCPVSLT